MSNGTNDNLEIFMSTAFGKSNVMLVYDVTTNISGKVNRHLANTLGGSRVDRNYPDETLNLNGYTVYIIYDHAKSNKPIFHAHFVPTRDRARETNYNRYRGQFDMRIYPTVRHDSYYKQPANSAPEHEKQQWEQNYLQSQASRNLLRDTTGRRSVVPYK